MLQIIFFKYKLPLNGKIRSSSRLTCDMEVFKQLKLILIEYYRLIIYKQEKEARKNSQPNIENCGNFHAAIL